MKIIALNFKIIALKKKMYLILSRFCFMIWMVILWIWILFGEGAIMSWFSELSQMVSRNSLTLLFNRLTELNSWGITE